MAAVVASITANSDQLEVSAVSVASTIVEDLTVAAINQPEVCLYTWVSKGDAHKLTHLLVGPKKLFSNY